MKRSLFYLITFVLTFDLFSVSEQSLQSFNNDIDFEMPHLIVDYNLNPSNTISLKAFTSKNIKNLDAKKFNQLTWMSLGYPRLLKTKVSDNDEAQMFHFNDEGLFAFIETLNQDYKTALTGALLDKYSINVSTTQIVNIPLAYFKCEINFYDRNGLINISIHGQVDDFDKHPYRLMLKTPMSSTERKLFEERVKKNQHVVWSFCKVKSKYIDEKTINFKITLDEMDQLQLSDRIFDKSEFAYLTRHQIDSLSNEIYSSFDILDISEDEFKLKFYDQFLKKVNFKQLNKVRLDKAIKLLSKYSLDVNKINMSVDAITKEFSKLFKVDKEENISLITVDREFDDSLEENNRDFKEGPKNFVGVFCVESSVQVVLNKKVQISELNSENKDGIEWELKDSQILPKFIYLAKIKRSSLTTFDIPQVKFVKSIPKFQHSFTFTLNDVKIYESGDITNLKNQSTKLNHSQIEESQKISNKLSKLEKNQKETNKIENTTTNYPNTKESMKKLPCEFNHCLNNGHCVKLIENTNIIYVCSCQEQFSGIRCEYQQNKK